MVSEAISIGKHIGDYCIIANMSSSPTSSVYQAEHTLPAHASVIIKIMHATHLPEHRRNQFFKEVQLLKKLKHAHLLPILDAGIFEDMPYLVTEYAPGGSLRDRIKPSHALPLQEALTILSQVGQALQRAHRLNIIHGNLKPENILFDEENGALLADFSLVTTMDALSDLRQTNSLPYMAPEQFQGWMTRESDQYALGCIAYELLTGQVPLLASTFSEFKSKHATEKPVAPTQLNLLLPISVEEAILKSMEKKSEHRYPSVKDFLASLSTSTSLQRSTARQYLTDAATPSFAQLPLYRTKMTGVTRAARPEPERIGTILPVSLTAPTQQYKEYKKPVLTSSPIKDTSPTAGTKISTRVPLPLSSPLRVSDRRGGNSLSRQMWFILVSLLLVIIIITFAALRLAPPSSFSLKPAPTAISQNFFPTPILTLAPTRRPMPTPTHAPASKLASIPTPTFLPSPTSLPSPTPSPTPAPTLMVTPTSLQAETDCQRSGLYYICRVTLLLPRNYPGNIKWYASAGNLSVFFSPSKGSLSPGQQQPVTAQVLTACPHTGTLNFFSKNTSASVPWAC